MRAFAPLLMLAVAGCATPPNEPSLAHRPAEAIDPRLPLPADPAPGPVDPALAASLNQLVSDGTEGGRAFDAAVGEAEAAANAAGPAQSESWIVAQQALSRLEATRAASTKALADVDSIATARVQAKGGMTRADLAAVDAASSQLRAVTDRQAQIVTAIAARLAR
jgi:hypothetical protein